MPLWWSNSRHAPHSHVTSKGHCTLEELIRAVSGRSRVVQVRAQLEVWGERTILSMPAGQLAPYVACLLGARMVRFGRFLGPDGEPSTWLENERMRPITPGATIGVTGTSAAFRASSMAALSPSPLCMRRRFSSCASCLSSALSREPSFFTTTAVEAPGSATSPSPRMLSVRSRRVPSLFVQATVALGCTEASPWLVASSGTV
mmetsp:Transcript_129764/g.224298  ORF Transcript_129764/g.224298 Transcript_129764/m.224298 type:complete len:203 (+) Transcript_129764:1402-2010(+)